MHHSPRVWANEGICFHVTEKVNYSKVGHYSAPFPPCHWHIHTKKLQADKGFEGWVNPAPHTVSVTYIFPAFSSRAHSKVTSQLPDVKKRGGTEGMAGCVIQRTRDKEKCRREQTYRVKIGAAIQQVCVRGERKGGFIKLNQRKVTAGGHAELAELCATEIYRHTLFYVTPVEILTTKDDTMGK